MQTKLAVITPEANVLRSCFYLLCLFIPVSVSSPVSPNNPIREWSIAILAENFTILVVIETMSDSDVLKKRDALLLYIINHAPYCCTTSVFENNEE